jgi:hypothetical protein
MLVDFGNQGVAAGQRTSPVISAHMPNLISTRFTKTTRARPCIVDPQSGQADADRQRKHVILRDPVRQYAEGFCANARDQRGCGGVCRALARYGHGRKPDGGLSKAAPAAISAAERIGVDVPKGIATDSPLTAFTAQVAARAPGGGPLMKAIEESRDALKGAGLPPRRRPAARATLRWPATITPRRSRVVQADRQIRRQRGLRQSFAIGRSEQADAADETKNTTAGIIGRRAESFHCRAAARRSIPLPRQPGSPTADLRRHQGTANPYRGNAR